MKYFVINQCTSLFCMIEISREVALGAETFDRKIVVVGEGKPSKGEKAERERKKSDFWGYNWNKAYIFENLPSISRSLIK